MITRVVIVCAILCSTRDSIAVEPAAAVYIEVEQPNLGELLKMAVAGDGNETVAGFFTDVSRERRNALFEELGKKARVAIIERMVKEPSGKWALDEKWEPAAIVIGRSGGVLDSRILRTESDYSYDVNVELVDAGFDAEDPSTRTGVLSIRLRLSGSGLGLSHAELVYVPFQWQLLYKTNVKALRDQASAREQSQHGLKPR